MRFLLRTVPARARAGALVIVCAACGGTKAPPSAAPAKPPARGVVSIATGDRFSCAATSDGAVHCWGSNDSRQLGDGTTTSRARPIRVANVSRVAELVAGRDHVCGRHTDGTVTCWGDGAEPAKREDVRDAVQLAAGPHGTCARIKDGAVMCWGERLRHAVHAFSGAIDVAVGFPHACARAANGSVSCWTQDKEQPDTAEVKDAAGARALSINKGTTCVLMGGPLVRCWGNPWPLLDVPRMGRPAIPETLREGLDGAVSLSVGFDQMCIRTAVGRVRCAGGQKETGLEDVVGLERVSQLAIGAGHACAISGGDVHCWGAAALGQLGDGTLSWLVTPAEVPELRGATRVELGSDHVCGWTTQGRRCRGQATPDARATIYPGLDVVQVVASQNTCLLLRSGKVRCHANGLPGEAIPETPPTTTEVPGVSDVIELAAGWHFTCARLRDRTVRCWVDEDRASAAPQNSTWARRPFGPVTLVPGIARVEQIAATGFSACARLEGGELFCWEFLDNRELKITDAFEPPRRALGLAGVVDVAVAINHTCALLADGTMWCWGANEHAQLGNGAMEEERNRSAERDVAVRVAGIGRVRRMAVHDDGSCALLEDQTVRCWGYNGGYRFGDFVDHRARPVRVDLDWQSRATSP